METRDNIRALTLQLRKMGKAESPACQCGHHKQDGYHITFTCPRAERKRVQLIGYRKTWAELDQPIWINTGPEPEDIIDGGEEWFLENFHLLT